MEVEIGLKEGLQGAGPYKLQLYFDIQKLSVNYGLY
jgi:hypothetical protein